MTTDAPATGDTPTTSEPTTTPDTGAPDLAAEVEKWKAAARKHEDRAKANAKAAQELDTVRQSAMTEQERAVATAKAEARAETLREVGAERVGDAVRLAAAGRTVNVDALLEGIDRNRFLSDEGLPDTQAIQTWVDKVAPPPSEEKPTQGLPDLGQGARGSAALNGDPILASLKAKLGI